MKRIGFITASMLKIGSIGFGGGTALVPVIEDEIVEKHQIVTQAEFNNDVVIASMTPGAMPVEIAAGVGYTAAGKRGMLAAAAAMAFPGAFLTVLILILTLHASDWITIQIGYLAAGISAFIIFTLLSYSFGTISLVNSKRKKILYGFIIIGVFILSAEKNVYQLLGVDKTPVFSLSAFQILSVALFIILFTGGNLRCIKKSIPALIISVCYVLCAGSSPVIPAGAEPMILGVMILLAGVGMVQAVRTNHHSKSLAAKELWMTSICWIAFAVLLSLPAIFICEETFQLLGNGCISSLLSFGGGDAYLTVAQSLFVDNQMISYADFYGKVVSVANILPGSILCKVLTGVAYIMGYTIHKSIWEGIVTAIAGFACSVAASGVIFIIIRIIYEKYEDLTIFVTMKNLIRPIISGLLLNVVLSLYVSEIQIQIQNSWNTFPVLGIFVVILLLNVWMKRKNDIPLIGKILISALIALVGCNLMNYTI